MTPVGTEIITTGPITQYPVRLTIYKTNYLTLEYTGVRESRKREGVGMRRRLRLATRMRLLCSETSALILIIHFLKG